MSLGDMLLAESIASANCMLNNVQYCSVNKTFKALSTDTCPIVVKNWNQCVKSWNNIPKKVKMKFLGVDY